MKETNEWPTKRSLVSETSKLFDPLGWLAPVIIKAKILFQGLWQAGLSWDQKLPEDIAKAWLHIRNELHLLEKIKIDRWIGKSLFTLSFELHGFSDASERAYAAVIYARIVNRDGSIHVVMLTSKTRVAPIHPITLPRLELCGFVLLANLIENVKKAFGVNDENTHSWTDSTIVLGWLRTNPSRLKTFVANRVVEVHNHFNISQCHHIEGTKNPADCAPRGIDPSELKDQTLWWNGPLVFKGTSIVMDPRFRNSGSDVRTKNEDFISTRDQFGQRSGRIVQEVLQFRTTSENHSWILGKFEGDEKITYHGVVSHVYKQH